MRTYLVATLATAFCAILLLAQQSALRQFRAFRHYSEIGHLAFDSQSSLKLAAATISLTSAGEVSISGREDDGRKWVAWLKVNGGIGDTDVWIGDFDHNGREDLLITSFFPKNGRCLEPETVTFLMIDSAGRAVPWTTSTYIPKGPRFPTVPPVLVDAGAGRAGIVSTSCEYGDPVRLGEDRSVTGIYLAENARWKLERALSPSYSEQLSRLIRQTYRFREGADRWKAIEPDKWPDIGNLSMEPVPPGTIIASTQVADQACNGAVRLAVQNGRIISPSAPDPCDEAGKFRFTLSNGQACFGIPTVVLDRPSGREIVTPDTPRIQSSIDEIVRDRVAITFAGQTWPGHCSPAYLWATVPRG